MSAKEQFSKAAEETTSLFRKLEDIRAQMRSAKTGDERAALEAEAARLNELLKKVKAQMKVAADQLVNPPEAKASWWKRVVQRMSSKGNGVDLQSLRSPVLRDLSASCELFPPATAEELMVVEEACAIALPGALREILSESNGLLASYGAKLLWSTAEIIQHNKKFWEDQTLRDQYESFDKLFFIGDDGSGDQFAFAIEQDRKVGRSDIYRWEHETDARTRYAKKLDEFLRKAARAEG
jgi:hypothetical protein